MSLKSLNQTTSSAFLKPDLETKLLKAALIGLCSDVDRYFRVTFDINIFQEVAESDFNKIKSIFPNFRELSLEQFNRLLFTFIGIRNNVAHLFLNKQIYLDEDIEGFIKIHTDLPYELTNKKEATVFGAICVCLLFSQNYQLWTFNTEAMRHNIFKEVKKSSVADYQRDFQNSANSLVGTGKPCRPEEHLFFTKTDIMFFNEEVKKTLTKLLFDFEEHASESKKMSIKASSIKTLLGKYKCLKNKPLLIERISNLRNYWLHGYRLFDHIKSGNQDFDFDFDYLFELLLDIKSVFKGTPHSREILNDISDCGSKMIDFYTLRSIEISYKIIDSAIFDKEKIRERILNSVKAYRRCMNAESWFYDRAKLLLSEKNKVWYLAANKFEDKKERILRADKIDVFEFEAKNGFDIGDAHIDTEEMVLMCISSPQEQQLKINGKYLSEYKTSKPGTYGIFNIHSVQL